MTNPSHLLALEEMRQMYQQVSQAGDALDNKASSMLDNASLILGLFGVLQITLFKQGQSPLYQIMLALIVILYLLMVALSMNAITPRIFRTPIKADWDVLSEHLLIKKERDATLKLISGYVEQIEYNKVQNERKAKRVQWAMIIFFTIIFLLLVLSIIPR